MNWTRRTCRAFLPMTLMAVAFFLTACSESYEKRSFSLEGLTLGQTESEVQKLLRQQGFKRFHSNIWIAPYQEGRQRVIYETVGGTVWKLFRAMEGHNASLEENRKLAIAQFGDPDEAKTVEHPRMGKGQELMYRGDRSDKTALLTVTVRDRVITWNLVSETTKTAAVEEAKKRQRDRAKRCEELLSKPVEQLSVNERLEAMDCATAPLFKMMENQ